MPAIKADHYHVWDHNGAAWGTVERDVPKVSGIGTEKKRFYSLKKDMDDLRQAGGVKGIVDTNIVSLPTKSHVLGRELWALKVGKGSATKVLFTGCHHAREWISVEMPFLVAHYLIENYNANPTTDKEKRIYHLLQNREVWFVPMVNPDGHDHTVTSERGWRANRNSQTFANDTTITAPAYKSVATRQIDIAAGTYTGIDVNRNYATSTWGQETFHPLDPTAAVTSRDPADGGANSTWCGPSSGSENETKAISALDTTVGFKANISYHNYGLFLLQPDPAKDANDAYVKAVGEGMLQVINAKAATAYRFGAPSVVLYAATGSQMDHFYEKQAGRPSYTPEVRPAGNNQAHGFSALPEAQIKPCFEENLGAALALINSGGFSSAPTGHQVKIEWKWPPVTVQAVQNCWNVFLNWQP